MGIAFGAQSGSRLDTCEVVVGPTSHFHAPILKEQLEVGRRGGPTETARSKAAEVDYAEFFKVALEYVGTGGLGQAPKQVGIFDRCKGADGAAS